MIIIVIKRLYCTKIPKQGRKKKVEKVMLQTKNRKTTFIVNHN